MQWPGRSTIRLQLLGLFGLWVFALVAVLGLDEWGRRQHAEALRQLGDETLVSLRRIQAVSDSYGLDVVNTVFRVRNNALEWSAGRDAMDTARNRIDTEWASLQALPHTRDEAVLLHQIAVARVRADDLMAKLRLALQTHDVRAFGYLSGSEVFPAIDPVTSRLQHLGTLVLARGQQQVREENARALNAGNLRIGLSLFMLLLAGWFANRVLRNIYRGVEALIELTSQMRRHDYAALPSYRADGEIGEVMDSFLVMRDDVRDSEAAQSEMLARNEQVRRTLARSEDFQRSLFAAAQVAVMSIDLAGRFSSFNPYAEQLSGYEASAMIGQRSLARLLLLTEVREVAEHLGTVLGENVPADARLIPALIELGLQANEWTLVRKDGEKVPILLATSAMHDENNEIIGYLCVATDLTRIKTLEDALRASELAERDANLAKSEFLAAMSHEIRTPMIGVTGMLEVLSHETLEPGQRRIVGTIQDSAQALLRILGDILDFSKIDAGRLELAPVALSMEPLLRKTVENYFDSASSKGLALVCEIDPNVSAAHVGDPLRLRQILSNFLSNALKFTEHGSVVAALESLGVDADGERLCLRVSDTGIGVTAEQQERLFQPFSQAEGSTTRRFGGTGLGLVICKRLAELMGGTITMESASGSGTTMRLLLTLPVAEAADVDDVSELASERDQFQPRATPDVLQAENDRSLVLLVDDHPTNRLVVARQLALAGYACETAEDGLEGLERWRSGRYALVLSDIHMPRMDGYQLTRALREEEVREGRVRIPVIALTAAALTSEAQRCLAAGMDDYLSKPVSIRQLAECLGRWLPHAHPVLATQVQTPAIAIAPVVTQSASEQTGTTQSDPAQNTTAQTAAAVLDSSVLDALTGGDIAQRSLLLDDYLATTTNDLEAVVRAFANNDYPQLARAAHRIKGAAMLVGAGELASVAAAFEHAARTADAPRVTPLFAELEAAVEHLRMHVVQNV